MAIATINPATGETVRTFDDLSEAQIDIVLEHAERTFTSYRRSHVRVRVAALHRLADLLEAEQDRLGRLMTLEMGKLVQGGRDEVLKCARGCRYYAEQGGAFLADVPVPTNPGLNNVVRYRPLGTILAIMPWNFPFWQVFRVAVPAVLAGNVVLLKHASNVPQCALAIEDLFRRAGFPEGVLQALLIELPALPRVIEDPRVVAISLTGSEVAGMEVASRAGRRLKKVVLELGGNDAFIVMSSADLAAAVETGVKARILNAGQSCIAAKRFIVAESVADEFERRFTARMRSLRVGDPLDAATEIGPLARASVRDGLHDQVEQSVAAGARVLTGGALMGGPGFYYPPTVLADVPSDAPAAREELFGPVASVFRVPDADAAIALANDTRFGLGCSVWTREQAEQARFIEEIETGQVFVNSMVASDPRLPFGGIKHSGYGRELGEWGIREFLNVQTVSIDTAASTPRQP